MKEHPPGRLRQIVFSPWSLAALIVVPFWPVLIGQIPFFPTYGPEEFLNQWLPYLWFFRASYLAGEFPLWSHNLLAGFPLAAFPHSGSFYPPSLLFCALPFTPAFIVFVLLHLACRTGLMYGLLREWPRDREEAWLGAAIYGLFGSAMHITGHLELFNTLTWLPGLFWFALRLGRRGRALDFFGLAGFSVLSYLAGDAEVCLYSWITIMAWLALAEQTSAQRLAVIFCAGLVSALVCAAPLLLANNYLSHSFRAAHLVNPTGRWEAALTMLVFPWSCVSSMPLAGQRFWPYLSILLPVGALAAVTDPRQRRLVLVTASLTGFGALFFLNPWPLNLLFESIPLFKYSSTDMRFRFFFPALILALGLAASGFHRLISGPDRASLLRIAAFLLFFVLLQNLVAVIDLLHQPDHPAVPLSRLLLTPVLSALAATYLIRARRKSAIPAVPRAWIVAILALDLVALAILGVPRSTPDFINRPGISPALEGPAAPERLQPVSRFYADLGMWRVFRLDEGPGFIIGFIRNGLARHTELSNQIFAGNMYYFDPRLLRPETKPLLDFLAVRYFLANPNVFWGKEKPPLEPPGFDEIPTAAGLRLFTSRDALDHYGLYSHAIVMSDDAAKKLLFDPARFDPSWLLILAPGQGPATATPGRPRPRRPGDVTVAAYGTCSALLRVETGGAAWLSIAESYYPGWRAWVDGKETRMLRANYAYQAVELPTAGRHEVRLAFTPVEFRIGLYFGTASLITLLVFAGLAFRRRSAAPGLSDERSIGSVPA